MRTVGRSADAVSQPGAAIGQKVYCPVSGVLFEVTSESAKIDSASGPIFACCQGCAQYLSNDRERVLALRGIDVRS